MALQGLRGLGSSAARRSGGLSAYGRTPEEAELTLLQKIGGTASSGLASIGNLLDLPGSMIRDVVGGENPFDQLLSPLQNTNRLTGRDVLQRFGLRKNKETGFVPLADPGEFGRDVLGFGAEVLLDPLTYLTFGGSALTKTGKAAEKSGALKYLRELGRNKGIGVREARTTLGAEDLLKATKNEDAYKKLFDVAAEKMGTTGDDLLRQNEALGWTVGVGLPFGKPVTGFNLGPLSAKYNRVADKVGDVTRTAAPTRALRMLFDNSAGGKFSKVDQEIAERAYLDRSGALATAKQNQLKMAAEREPLLDEWRALVRDKMDEGYDPDFDPRDMAEFQRSARAELQGEIDADPMMPIFVKYRDTHRWLREKLRANPDQELNQIFGADVMREDFNSQLLNDRLQAVTDGGLSEDQFKDMLLGRKPVVEQSQIDWRARQMFESAKRQGQIIPDPERFIPGDIVIADDRGNYGRVQSIGERTSKVFFQNHEKGTSATVNLPNDELRRAYKGNSEQGMAFATALTDKAFDDIVRGAREYGGDVDEILGSILPAKARLAVTDEMKAKIAKHAENMQEAQRAAYQALEDAGLPVTWLRREGDDFGQVSTATPPVAARITGNARNPILNDIRKKARIRDLNDVNRELTGSHEQIRQLPLNLAEQFDAHGTNLDGMMNVLDNGIDPNRAFHTAQLSDTHGSQPGLGLRTHNSFVLVSKPGKNLKDGIGAVLVDPLNADSIPELSRLYPDVTFIPSADAATGLQSVGKSTSSARPATGFGVEHAERYVDPRVMEKVAGEGQPLQTGFGSMLSRNSVTRDLPTHVVNELHRSSRYRQRTNETLEDAASRVLEDYGNKLNPRYGLDEESSLLLDAAERDPNGADVVAELTQMGREKHAQDIVGFLAGRKQNDLYTRNGLDDFFRYQKGAQLTLAGVNATYDVLGRKARQQGGTVPVQEALRRAGFDVESGLALKAFQQRTGIDPATAMIDEETVRSITSVMRPAVDPNWAEKLGQWVDRANRQFKTLVTIPFPSFAARNHSSGQFQNLVASGEINSALDLVSYGKEYAASKRLFQTLNKGGELSDVDREMLRELSAYRVIGQHGFEDIPLHGQPRPNIAEEMKIVPGAAFTPNSVSESFARAHQKAMDTPWLKPKDNPRFAELKRKDVLTAAEANELTELQRASSGSTANKVLNRVRAAGGGIIEQGGKINHVVEWQNRVPMYSYLRKRGWSPEAAAKKVHDLQFDYGDVTDFEKRVMKRAMPFYSFTRFIVPQVVDTLRTRPGGGIAQTIRATRSGQDSERPLPDWIAQGTSIPLGTKEDGSQSYLTGLGLAHEVPLQFLGGGVRGAGMEALGMLNPLVKGPLEYATGESFFQRGPMGGRDIDTMDPVIGRILTSLGVQEEDASGRAKPFISPLVENVAVNTPASRLLTTIRTLLDSRKYETSGAFPGDALAMNLLTGLRVSDVSPAAQDAVLRDAASALARNSGARTYETVYFNESQIEETRKTDPRRAEQMEAFNALRNLLGRKAKERKKAIVGSRYK